LTRDIQTHMDAMNAASPAGSGIPYAPGAIIHGQQMSLTPAQRSAQTPIQNSTIERLESEWTGASLARKRDIVKGIEDILRGFPGTKSTQLANFKRQLGGRRRRKTGKTRKHSRKQK